ncbi:MAG: GTPase [Pseudomonadota bacterium]
MNDRTLHELHAIGQIEGCASEIDRMKGALEKIPLWLPSTVLIKECLEASNMVETLKKRFDQKLVVTIIGPSGSGKSTLLNALAGIDEFSESGADRPTTKDILILSKTREDAQLLIQDLGRENVAIRVSDHAAFSENMLLIDTPDTDSTQRNEHIPLIQKAIGLSDVLICLFDVENPKRKDHTDFLAPYVRMFDGESLIVALNKCDRQSQYELTESILPEFMNYIRNAWGKKVDSLYCISGRSHLKNPDWNPNASPRHNLDQYEAFKENIENTFPLKRFRIDRRVMNAKELKNYIRGRICEESAKDQKRLELSLDRMRDIEREAFRSTLDALKADDADPAFSVMVSLYNRLAQQWMGPVGWLIAVWYRILVFGSAASAVFRFANPFHHVKEWMASLKHMNDSTGLTEDSKGGKQIRSALQRYRLVLLKNWMDVGEQLVQSRFNPSVRQLDTVVSVEEDLESELVSIWSFGLEYEINRTADRLSTLFLQILFNLPVLAILCYAGWITASEFLMGRFLPADYFLHAALAISIFLFLCFFTLQLCIRLAGNTRRMKKRVFSHLHQEAKSGERLSQSPVGEQIAMVLALSAWKSTDAD